MMNKKELEIWGKLNSDVLSLGYDLINVAWHKGDINSSKNLSRLQLMIEGDKGKSITVTDCVKVSKSISVVIDANELIKGQYNLEVSSPGINRPLVFQHDFIKYKGCEVMLKLKQSINGQRSFKCTIVSVEDDRIFFEGSLGKLDITFEQIMKAELNPIIKM